MHSMQNVVIPFKCTRGVHPPEAMMHFPLFQIFPYFLKMFRLHENVFQFCRFPTKFFGFRPLKFLMTVLIIDFEFKISSHIFAKRYIKFPIIVFPYFWKIPLDFVRFTCFLHTLRVFRFPPTLTMMHLCITQCTYT